MLSCCKVLTYDLCLFDPEWFSNETSDRSVRVSESSAVTLALISAAQYLLGQEQRSVWGIVSDSGAHGGSDLLSAHLLSEQERLDAAECTQEIKGCDSVCGIGAAHTGSSTLRLVRKLRRGSVVPGPSSHAVWGQLTFLTFQDEGSGWRDADHISLIQINHTESCWVVSYWISHESYCNEMEFESIIV